MSWILNLNSIRHAARSIEMSIGMASVYVKRTRGAVVLTYHGVAPEEQIVDRWVQTVHIDPSVLRRQLQFIARHFDVVDTLDPQNVDQSANRPQALITFDDGYRNFTTHALPVLKETGIPATLFITANCVEKRLRHPVFRCRAAVAHLPQANYDLDSLSERLTITDSDREEAGAVLSERIKRMRWEQASQLLQELESHFSEDEIRQINAKYETDEPMTWEEVTLAKQNGIEVGSHTLDHVVLNEAQSAETVRDQVAGSKRLITERVGACRIFAYPNGKAGDISCTAVDAVREAGYQQAFSTLPGVVREYEQDELRLMLPRLAVDKNWNAFRKYVSTAWRHNKRHRATAATVTSRNIQNSKPSHAG